jgi:small nuclear ribonucleoprotein (snRNP)-like protein
LQRNVYNQKSLFFQIKFPYGNVYKQISLKLHMVNGIERPLDLLNNSKGKEVLVHLKGDKQFVGTLLAFDIHINLVLDNIKEMENNEIKRNLGLTFLRGDTIIFISPASTALKKE